MVSELLGRSNRLGADPRNTDYAGGNTPVKSAGTDPVTGRPVELLWVARGAARPRRRRRPPLT